MNLWNANSSSDGFMIVFFKETVVASWYQTTFKISLRQTEGAYVGVIASDRPRPAYRATRSIGGRCHFGKLGGGGARYMKCVCVCVCVCVCMQNSITSHKIWGGVGGGGWEWGLKPALLM